VLVVNIALYGYVLAYGSDFFQMSIGATIRVANRDVHPTQNPWVGLGWVGLGWVRVDSWVEMVIRLGGDGYWSGERGC